MRPTIWPEWLEGEVLAKSAEKGAAGHAESLPEHTWLVLCRLADWMRLRPSLPELLGQPRLWHCLYWGAFLHDFGKVMPGFQGVLHGDASWRDRWGNHRHELFSLAFLDWITSGLNETERLWTAAAIISHHRDYADLRLLYPLPEEDEPDPLARQFDGLLADHVAGLYRWLSKCGWPWAEALGLAELGVAPVSFTNAPEEPIIDVSVRRIRSWLRNFGRLVNQLQRQNEQAVFRPLLVLRGTLINADHSASAHAPSLPRIQLSAQDILDSISTEARRVSWQNLYDHQQDMYRREGSALLIAPTGSGKTEAALLWATRQCETALAPPRLFYTLPYQASMNAMDRRLKRTFDRHSERAHGTGEHLSNVGLQHGRSLLALYQQLMEREYNPGEATRLARRIRDLNRLNYPPVRVFSPYQMLKAAYRLKGYEAQLVDYHNALFIFDEIHAYEVKRLALILKTIEHLRRYYQARFLVMSATFPSFIKSWLIEALDEPLEITAAPGLFREFQRHRIEVLEGDLLDRLSEVAADALSGSSVLVVANVVARTQEIYQELQCRLDDAGVEVILLHGSFNIRDRLEKEKLVQACTGATSQARRPVVLVATQVVEVSLDIDLDTIYTDPAPLEALVQRFGRVNRRRRMTLAPVRVFTQPADGQGIYDERLIAGTLRILQRENGRPVNEASVGGWLDEIYSGEVAADWQAEFTRYATEFEAAVLGTLRPFQSDRNLADQFYALFEGFEVLPDCYWDEYDTLSKESPMEARQLLVPISEGRFYQLKSKRLISTEIGSWPIVVAAPYSSELGLDLSALYT